MEKSKNIFKKPLQSTQQNIPIKEIFGGCVVTKDNRYIKIMEVKPITFGLKSYGEQNRIFSSFQSVLKVCPNKIQLTAMSFPANLEKQLDVLDQEIALEKNSSCLEIDKQYKDKLLEAQKFGISRRFFLSFQYEGRISGLFHEKSPSDIALELAKTENLIANTLKNCGNEVVPFDYDNMNYHTSEILYTILNRNESVDVPFSKYQESVYMKYLNDYQYPDFYIPPTDMVSPKNMSFMNSKYVVVNSQRGKPGTYYSYLYIPRNGYNSSVIPGWLQIFINSYDGVDTNIYLERVPKEQVINNIRRNLTYSQVSGNESSSTSQAFDNARETYDSGYYLKEGLAQGQDFYNMAIMLTVTGRSPEEVDDKVHNLKNIALTNGIKLKECSHNEEKCFFSALPLCSLDKKIWEKAKRNVLTEGAGTLYPFTAFEMNDPNGIYFGDDINSGSLALVDIFDTNKFQNSNIFICGQTGAGKTYSLLLMAIRMRIKHIPVFILAPEKEHEFRRICNALGGQFIQIGAGSPNRINIMEIHKKDESANESIDGNYQKISYLTEKVTFLKNFFKLLITDINIEETQLLDEAIIETYKKFGITTDNESLFDKDSFIKTTYKKMPTIEDLRNTLMENNKTVRLGTIINVLCNGSGSSFNGQTNVNLNNEFTVIGLEHLSGDMMPLGIYMAMDFVCSKIKEDRTKKKALFIDEWWKLAYNNIAAEYSLEIAKVIRAYGGAMIIATQQMKDILAVENGKFGEAVLNNCKSKILLQMDKQDAEIVQKLIGITNKETDAIKKSKRGEALFVSGENNIRIKFVASRIEHELITTDRQDLTKLASKKSKEKVFDLTPVQENQKFELFAYEKGGDIDEQ